MLTIDKQFQPPSTTDPVASKTGPGALTPDKKVDVDDSDSGKWLQRAKDAFAFSTTYVDNNYRGKWEDGINAFNSIHPSSSKYHSGSFEKRSKLYRPKTRSIIRKIEAAAAAAYFSNSDVLSIESENASDPKDCAAAEVMKELIQHHLTKTVPWFQVVQGGLQDAMVSGSAVAHVYWDTKTTADNTKLVNDHPKVDLIPIENIRIDPAASWVDPVETSPYIIHLIPMYVGDVKTMMAAGTWKKYSEGMIKQALQSKSDSTNQARLKRQGNPYDSDGKTISDYEVVWVQRHIHREDDIDYDFYTLGDVALLTDPVPLSETVFHGKRPYVIGNCVIETHKVFPSSIPELSKGLQEEANEISNQRLDNVKFSMNKRYIVARNKQVDIQSLIRNVPGGVTMADSTEDVREVSTPDVTQSAYLEQDRINTDMDELLGNFGAGTVQANKQLAQTVTGMSMMNSSANVLVEYTLRTFTETFIEPILNQLVLLERHYETDENLLKLVGKRAEVMKKLGTEDKTDELLQRELFVRVNVGMGATSPEQKINKLLSGLTAYGNLVKMQIPNLNIAEAGKEIFGALGYADGSRFLSIGENPEVQQLQAQVKQMQAQLQDKTQPVKIAQMNNETKVHIATMKEGNANNRKLVDHYSKLTEKGLGQVANDAAIKANANGAPAPKPQQQPMQGAQ
jgi:hypothetical protein